MLTAQTVSLANWRAVTPTYGFVRQLNIGGTLQRYIEGFSFYDTPIYRNALSLSVNHDTLTVLTTNMSLSALVPDGADTLEDDRLVTHGSLLTYALTAVLDHRSGVPSVSSYDYLDKYQVHLLDFDPDNNLVEIKRNTDSWLTLLPSTSSFDYRQQDYNDPTTQRFSYVRAGNHLFLSTACDQLTAQYSIGYDLTAGLVLSDTAHLSGGSGDENYVWVVQRMPTAERGWDNVSRWVKYYNCLGGNSDNTSVHIDSDATVPQLHNMLAITPVYPVLAVGVSAADTQLLPLKSFLSPSCHHTNGSHARDYTGIHFGTNQQTGALKPQLAYDSDLRHQKLVHDTTTYFHYPFDATQVALSASSLAQYGAVAGHSPMYSDRLYQSNYGYSCYTHHGNPSQRQNGTWLCSWLSGGDDCPVGQPVWMDRWYDPLTVTQGDALVASVTSGATSDKPLVWDVPSTHSLQPGVLYKYSRLGKTTNAALVSQLDASLVLWVNSWLPATDSSGYAHNVVSFATSNTKPGQPLVLDGQSYAYAPSKQPLCQQHKMSVGGWFYSANWATANGCQLLGNYYQGGFGIFYNTGVGATHLFTIVDNDSGYVFTVTTQGKKTGERRLPVADGNPQPSFVQVDRQGNKWVVDERSGNVYRMDNNCTVLDSVSMPSTVDIIAIDADGDDHIYVMDGNSNTVFEFDGTGTIVDSTTLGSWANNFLVDLDGVVTGLFTTPGTKGFVDSNNVIWAIVGTNIWRGGHPVYHLGPQAKQLAVDAQDNVWATYSNNRVLKLDNDGLLLFDIALPSNVQSDQLTLTLTRELDKNGYNDYVWVGALQQNKLIKLSMAGVVVGCIDLMQLFEQSISSFSINGLEVMLKGDNTGYDISRKYSLTQGIDSSAITAKVLLAECDSNRPTTVEVHYDASELSPGWHHLMLATDLVAGTIDMYVDGARQRETVTPNTYRISYRYKSPLMVGGDSGKFQPLIKELAVEGARYFTGQADDIRMYDIALDSDQVRALYWMRSEFTDIDWQIQATTRPHIEQVERFFKHRFPGHKSHVFDVNIKGLQIQDTALREIIEQGVRNAMSKIKPGYTDLREIVWT